MSRRKRKDNYDPIIGASAIFTLEHCRKSKMRVRITFDDGTILEGRVKNVNKIPKLFYNINSKEGTEIKSEIPSKITQIKNSKSEIIYP